MTWDLETAKRLHAVAGHPLDVLGVEWGEGEFENISVLTCRVCHWESRLPSWIMAETTSAIEMVHLGDVHSLWSVKHGDWEDVYILGGYAGSITQAELSWRYKSAPGPEHSNAVQMREMYAQDGHAYHELTEFDGGCGSGNLGRWDSVASIISTIKGHRADLAAGRTRPCALQCPICNPHIDRRQIGGRLRFEVLKRDSFRCVYCGANAKKTTLHVDHIIPRIRGGRTEASNLITACEDCNLGKGPIPLHERRLEARPA